MKYLITGIGGFVGSHLIERLSRDGHEIVGVDARLPADRQNGPWRDVALHQLSMMDSEALQTVLKKVRPERIIHLASAS